MKLSFSFSFAQKAVLLSALVVFVAFVSCRGQLRSVEREDEGTIPEAPPGRLEDSDLATAPLLDEKTSQSLPTTPLKDYLFPVMRGVKGSAWCACRSVGTSPHVGIDLNAASGQETSVAMSNGRVVDVTYDSACGWILWLEDSHRAKWRFVHLNKPEVRTGDIVKRGQILGHHSQYPKGGCGTGPHLHLERRSAGTHGSSEEFRTCQYGRSSCYYNPVSLIENGLVIRSESERQSVVAQSAAAAKQSLNFGEEPAVAKALRSCVSELGSWDVPNTLAAAVKNTPTNDEVIAEHFATFNEPVSLAVFVEGNRENVCSDAELQQPCVESWQLFSEEKGGNLKMHLSVSGSGSAFAGVRSEDALCLNLGEETEQLHFLVKLSDQRSLRVSLPHVAGEAGAEGADGGEVLQ